ncbi:MAG: histone deacetylase [Gemmatimonadota bacterium]
MAIVFTSSDCLGHPGMPEQPARLGTVLERLRAIPGLDLREAALASTEALTLVHPPDYISHLEASAAASQDAGEEVPLVPASWPAILGATGAILAATRQAIDSGGCTFAAVRPPGHHAGREHAMGFCPVNLVAIARESARRLGAERALIIDWDVHHGNGTQALVEADSTTRFVSMHQHPHYPGTGAASDRGVGNVFNLPLPPGLPHTTYLEALWEAVMRASRDFVPEIILISAGYDCLAGDPLGGFTLEPADCATWMTRLQEQWPDTPVVATMEGGYLPERLADGVAATVAAMR